jgi:hypothetical protein
LRFDFHQRNHLLDRYYFASEPLEDNLVTNEFRKACLASLLTAAGLASVIAPTRAAENDGAIPTMLSEVRPSLADLMTIAQLRHFKLNYAHRAGNWPLAAYELDKLEETFTRTARLYPEAAKVAQSKLIEEKTKPALAELRRAIAERDTAKFKSAYITVTQSCNQCHTAADYGFIAIGVPTKSPFSNQIFTPKR